MMVCRLGPEFSLNRPDSCGDAGWGSPAVCSIRAWSVCRGEVFGACGSESLQAASRAPLTINNRVCFVFMVEVIFEAIIYFDLPFDDCSVESNGRLFAA